MGRWMVDPNEHLGMDAGPRALPPIWEGQGTADMNNALPPQSYQSNMRAFEPPARYDPQMELQPPGETTGGPLSPIADRRYQIPERAPFPGELDFFNKTQIPGFSTETGDAVVLNPNPPPGVNMDAIRQNETLRALMRSNKVLRPDFILTPEQQQQFKGYGEDQDIRETLAARRYTGDPSAGATTEMQDRYVDHLRQLLRNNQ